MGPPTRGRRAFGALTPGYPPSPPPAAQGAYGTPPSPPPLLPPGTAGASPAVLEVFPKLALQPLHQVRPLDALQSFPGRLHEAPPFQGSCGLQPGKPDLRPAYRIGNLNLLVEPK